MRLGICVRWALLLGAVALILRAATADAAPPRERAIEQIPELMGRILESQEEIRERESEMGPVVRRYDDVLVQARARVEASASEEEAAEALVDYVEAYASRLEAQATALRSIESSVVRMRADARELVSAAEAVGTASETPEERRGFYQEHFEGVADATGELAERLERGDEAATVGDVLHASWASQATLDLPLGQLGPAGALAFGRKVEGLYARYQARSNQLRAERQSVRQLLDVLIERQLARRLDSLFADDGMGALGIGSLLAGGGSDSQDWQDLGSVVGRALGLPARSGGLGGDALAGGRRASLDRLDYFSRGSHRE